jgi:hypothetical protein
MAALKSEGERVFFFHQHTGKASGHLFLEGLDDVLGLRVLGEAVNLAESTTYAYFFSSQNPFHHKFLKAQSVDKITLVY